jgi:hypothetical protein
MRNTLAVIAGTLGLALACTGFLSAMIGALWSAPLQLCGIALIWGAILITKGY